MHVDSKDSTKQLNTIPMKQSTERIFGPLLHFLCYRGATQVQMEKGGFGGEMDKGWTEDEQV